MTNDIQAPESVPQADLAEDAVVNPEPGTLTFWSDIGCPWATLALHTLGKRAQERGVALQIDHRAFPLELFNRIPTPKVLVDAEIVAIAGTLPELGWRMWSGAEYTYPATLLPALEAVQAAKDPAVGGLAASAELDVALRRAYFVESRCISVHPIILEIAEDCPQVDAPALGEALAAGRGRAQVYQQWHVAEGPRIQGSPHLFTADGYAEHNPGASHRWTDRPPLDFPVQSHGFPVLDSYRPEWADELLDRLAA
jgi:predicted DsbA family dithiol-disulfide isomerase